jgi:hypothetical protein
VKRLTVLLIACALASPLAVHATAQSTLAQLHARRCAQLGHIAETFTEILERGSSYQAILDMLDNDLAKSPRAKSDLAIAATFRRVARQVALTPSWSQAQARVSIEMACLRGDYP